MKITTKTKFILLNILAFIVNVTPFIGLIVYLSLYAMALRTADKLNKYMKQIDVNETYTVHTVEVVRYLKFIRNKKIIIAGIIYHVLTTALIIYLFLK